MISLEKSKLSVIVFFIFSFVVPWIGWSIMALKGFNLYLFYTSYGCTIGGLVAIFIEKGKSGLWSILQSFRFNASLSAWGLAVIFPFVWQFISFVLFGALFNNNGIGKVELSNFSNLFSLHILWLLTTGPLSEELGWRGFFLPKLLNKYSFLKSNVILGLIWSFWHLPIMYQKWLTIPLSGVYFFVGVICFAFIIGIIYIISNGNLFLCILSHWAINATQEMFGSIFPGIELPNETFYVFSTFILVAFTILLFFIYKQELLNKKAF
ncbi:MAG: CPBP family intramembrane metalloprotease [Bacteroidetes bacterium]|nr:CPBP family intramembrane metalloprotease [Bacteroidota bacterium]